MAKVVDISSKKKHVAVLALCLLCDHRWAGVVPLGTNFFHLQCPRCNGKHSFVSFIPTALLNELD